MTNPYFNFHEKSGVEETLYQNFTDEIVQMFGVDLKFLPRKFQNQDLVLGEDVLSYFDSNFDITCYVENSDVFTESEDMFAKFGLQIEDQITLAVQKTRFLNDIGETPDVSDLIYYPMSSTLFEITHVEENTGNFQFGKQMQFVLKCKLYNYTGEDMTTGITEVDAINGINDTNSPDEDNEIQNDAVDIMNFDENNIFGNL